MGLASLPSRHHVGAALLGAIVIGAALAPAAALADDAWPEGREERVVDLDETDPGVVGCPDPLSVISWNGADDAGDPHAVAITAQLLDTDTDGWSSASWEAAAGTTLTAVTATRIDGGVDALAPGPTGTASDIVAFTFCGTAGTTGAPPESAARGSAAPGSADPDSADAGSAGDRPPPPVTVATCDDLLTVATPERVEVDPFAVAITAQAFDLGEPGWSNVGWEPAAGITLRAVLVTGTDGTVTDAGQATSATDVASLTFCGTVERATAEVPPIPPSTSVGRPTTPAAPTTSTSGAGSETTTQTRRAADPEPTADASEAALAGVTAGTPQAADEHVADPEASDAEANGTESDEIERNGTDDTDVTDDGAGTAPEPDDNLRDDTDNDDTDNDETEEVEVLGIQLTGQEEPNGSGPLGSGVALFAVLALLATAGGVLWSRHS